MTQGGPTAGAAAPPGEQQPSMSCQRTPPDCASPSAHTRSPGRTIRHSCRSSAGEAQLLHLRLDVVPQRAQRRLQRLPRQQLLRAAAARRARREGGQGAALAQRVLGRRSRLSHLRAAAAPAWRLPPPSAGPAAACGTASCVKAAAVCGPSVPCAHVAGSDSRACRASPWLRCGRCRAGMQPRPPLHPA